MKANFGIAFKKEKERWVFSALERDERGIFVARIG